MPLHFVIDTNFFVRLDIFVHKCAEKYKQYRISPKWCHSDLLDKEILNKKDDFIVYIPQCIMDEIDKNVNAKHYSSIIRNANNIKFIKNLDDNFFNIGQKIPKDKDSFLSSFLSDALKSPDAMALATAKFLKLPFITLNERMNNQINSGGIRKDFFYKVGILGSQNFGISYDKFLSEVKDEDYRKKFFGNVKVVNSQSLGISHNKFLNKEEDENYRKDFFYNIKVLDSKDFKFLYDKSKSPMRKVEKIRKLLVFTIEGFKKTLRDSGAETSPSEELLKQVQLLNY